MASEELTPSECAILMVLMAEAREVPNTELKERYGLDVRKENRDKLNGMGLVKSEKPGRTFIHVLDEEGWIRVEKDLNFDSPRARALGGALAALHTNLRDRVIPRTQYTTFGELFSRGQAAVQGSPRQTSDMEPRIRSTYKALATDSSEWVGLAQLRPFFDDVPRPDLDDALLQLSRKDGVTFVPESNQKMLTPDVVKAAVHIGDQDKHLLAIGV